MRRLSAIVGAALAARVLLDLAPAVGLAGLGPAGSVGLLGLVAAGLVAARPRWTASPADLAAVAYALLIGLAALHGVDPLRWTAIYGTPVLLYAAGRACPTEEIERWLLLVAAVAVVPLTAAALALITGQPDTYVLNGYPRLLGAYANPHGHAVALALFGSVGLCLAESGPGPTRRYGAVMFALSLAFLLLTWVRTALLLLGLQAVAYLWLRGRRRWLLAVPAAALLALAISPGLRDRFSDIAAVLSGHPPPGGWGAVGSHRIDIWAEIWDGFTAAGPVGMLFGLGTGAQFGLHHEGLEPHNEWFTLWIQGGILLPVAWIAWVMLAGRAALQRAVGAVDPLRAHAAAWALAVLLCAPISNDVLQRLALAGWVFAVLGAAGSDREPSAEGGGERDREVVVDPAGQELGGGAEGGRDQGHAPRQLGVP